MNILGMRGDPAYQLELHEHLLFYSRITCVVTIVLTLGGAGLDRAFYPAYSTEFAWMRIGASFLVGLVLLSYSLPWGRRLPWAGLPAIFGL